MEVSFPGSLSGTGATAPPVRGSLRLQFISAAPRTIKRKIREGLMGTPRAMPAR